MNEKQNTVKLMLDYMQGPIWISDAETGFPITGIDVVDTDEKLAKLNMECCSLFSECYEFDSHGQACYFNEETKAQNKERILSLLNMIKVRLTEINDGSFLVEDMESGRWEN